MEVFLSGWSRFHVTVHREKSVWLYWYLECKVEIVGQKDFLKMDILLLKMDIYAPQKLFGAVF